MATYFAGVAAASALDRVGREERLSQDLPKRQRFFRKTQPVKKKPTAPPPDGLEIFDAADAIDVPERRFDFTA